MTFSFKTDKGNVREVNEDSIAHGYSKQGYLCIAVADGMGGHNCGEVASDIAVRATLEFLKAQEELNCENVKELLLKAIFHANSIIIEEGNKSEACKDMGTTIVLMCMIEQSLFFAHCGDSRAYIFRDNELIQLTQDHSYTEELIKIGFLTREEAENHPSKNVITKALGTIDGAEPEPGSIELEKNDLILICTDGLSNMLTQDEITDILRSETNTEILSDKLIEEALSKGGNDNVTVSVIRC